jgi:hypothetical protein
MVSSLILECLSRRFQSFPVNCSNLQGKGKGGAQSIAADVLSEKLVRQEIFIHADYL